ncbi:MAG: hypothetical protein IT198_12505 [Acidimicrobiia bacterium]|nr:hypothetical protein [Acidimicrobiia bacterium]
MAGSIPNRNLFVGRTAELARLLGYFRDKRFDGTFVLGMPGVGKSRLVREFTGIVGSREHPILHPGREGSRREAVSELDVRDEIAQGGSQRSRSCTIVVDEDPATTHLADSLDTSLQDARLTSAFVIVCGRSRQGIQESVRSFVGSHRMGTLRVGPLSVPETQSLVEEALGGPVEMDVLSAVYGISRGVPGIAVDVLSTGVQEGSLVRGRDAWRRIADLNPSEEMADEVLRSVEGLAEPDRHGLDLIALGGGMVWEVLAPLVGLESLVALEAAGLVEVREHDGPDTVSLASPLVTMLVRREMKPARRRVLATGLLEAACAHDEMLETGDPAVLMQLFDAARVEPATSLLERAALSAVEAGHLDDADRLAGRLIDVGTGVEARFLMASVKTARGDTVGALEALDDIATLPDESTSAEILTRRAGILFDSGATDQAMDLLRGADEHFDSPEARARIRTTQLELCGYARDWAEAMQISGRILGEDGGYEEVRRRAETMCLVVASMTGPVEAHERAVGQIYAEPIRVRDDLGFWRLYVAYSFGIYGGFLREATASVLSALDELMQNAAHNMFCGAVALGAGALQQYRGLLGESRELLRFACRALGTADPMGFQQLALTRLASTCGMAGDREGLRECLELLDAPGVRISAATTVRAHAWRLVLDGELSSAADLCTSSATTSIEEEAVLAWPLVLLHDAVRIGYAEGSIEPLLQLKSTYGGAFAVAAADHAEALGRGWPSELMGVSRRFEELGYQLYAAEAAGQAGMVLEADGRRKAAQEARRLASKLAARCTHAATPALAVRPRDLTARELEVARMAAVGRTSPEIADALCLSVRTVDNHLGSVYAKLGIEGRNDLGVALEDRTSTGETVPDGTAGTFDTPAHK